MSMKPAPKDAPFAMGEDGERFGTSTKQAADSLAGPRAATCAPTRRSTCPWGAEEEEDEEALAAAAAAKQRRKDSVRASAIGVSNEDTKSVYEDTIKMRNASKKTNGGGGGAAACFNWAE